uniref:UDP-glucuronosyltransferase n=1 Tax=Plectus sambesii TaxID=2011161 RepID=A0A914WLU2_9BILA
MSIASLIVLIVAIHSVHSVHLLVGSHSMSLSHVKLTFDVAEDMQNTGRHIVTEIRWPVMKVIADYPARKGFRSLLLNKTYEHASKLDFLPAMIDDSGWKKDDGIVDILKMFKGAWPLLSLPCEEALEAEKVARNLTSEGYNLGILDPFSGLCGAVAMRSGKFPFVVLSPLVEPFTLGLVAGFPVPYSYVMSLTVAKADHEMNLIDRSANVLGHSFFRFFMWLQSYLLAKQFADKSDAAELFKGFGNTMVFTNSHRFLEWPIPTSLARIDIGHRDTHGEDKIPKEILDFIEDEQSLGTIIFSMSTYTSSGKMPEEVMSMFAAAFAKFSEYRFIWRIHDFPSELKAKNIHTVKWIPQTELLNHKKTVLLITHGGQNSVLEAINAGVPMIGIPMMGDQHPNIERVRTRILGLRLTKSELTEENIAKKIQELLQNQIYTTNAKKLASMLSTERSFLSHTNSTWWLEYTLRHVNQLGWIIPKGADQGYLVHFGFDILGVFFLCSLLLS